MPKGIYVHKPFSEEVKRKMSLSHKGKKPYLMTDEVRKNMSRAMTGKNLGNTHGFKKGQYLGGSTGKHWKLSEATRKRQSDARKGKSLSLETRKKISLNQIGRKLSEEHKRNIGISLRGDKSSFWKGGISYEPYSSAWNKPLKVSIRKRDNYTCQICFNEGLIVHHIDYNKQNCDPNNLITVCRKCHSKTNFNREYWKQYFSKICQQQ